MRKTHGAEQYVCVTCGRTDSPEWRKVRGAFHEIRNDQKPISGTGTSGTQDVM